jgi:uncharacterized protein (DUF488 family)
MNQSPIFSVGYGARDIYAFIKVLKKYDIDYLIDVRSKPYSHFKPDFSKKSLEQHLTENNIRYVFMGEALGGQPDDPTCYDKAGKVDYQKCRLRPRFQAGIERLRKANDQQLRVVIMCSEGKPESCHRAKLIGEVLDQEGITIQHIDENDNLLTHTQVMLRVIKGQPSLFGENFFKHTSRKSYTKADVEPE